MAKKILITGGMRSGKSRYGLELASEENGLFRRAFIATAEPLDQEMSIRIARHRQERGDSFVTIEEPVALAEALDRIKEDFDLILVDCLTLWINNLIHYGMEEMKAREEVDRFLKVVFHHPASLIFITNEVGLGLAAENSLARRFVDELGRLNQQLASLCDEVIFMVSGIPQAIKGQHERKFSL